ncbi:hypothetical protein [Actinomadura parmotrematis]|uniref:Uncharacterized protein n=1 Tax=Actinomadura parmotrematis TaxID=2864039 RepID=A0ABS7FRH6_9ACTN|nr:hypothetical protein [Actinomadura parmotrematis]MBW8482998.1 hypothetical protein [Actinomadura parmotrematis]
MAGNVGDTAHAPAEEAGAPGGTSRPGRAGGPLERLTVNLTARSSRALEEAVRMTGDSKTDTVNRAVQLYALIEEIITSGGTVYVREAGGDELQRLRFI